MLSYPAKILKDGDFFLVSFRDFYHEEPVTQGGTYEEALAVAADWLLSVATIAKEKQEELPQPSQAKNEEVLIEMPQSADFKPALIRS